MQSVDSCMQVKKEKPSFRQLNFALNSFPENMWLTPVAWRLLALQPFAQVIVKRLPRNCDCDLMSVRGNEGTHHPSPARLTTIKTLKMCNPLSCLTTKFEGGGSSLLHPCSLNHNVQCSAYYCVLPSLALAQPSFVVRKIYIKEARRAQG